MLVHEDAWWNVERYPKPPLCSPILTDERDPAVIRLISVLPLPSTWALVPSVFAHAGCCHNEVTAIASRYIRKRVKPNLHLAEMLAAYTLNEAAPYLCSEKHEYQEQLPMQVPDTVKEHAVQPKPFEEYVATRPPAKREVLNRAEEDRKEGKRDIKSFFVKLEKNGFKRSSDTKFFGPSGTYAGRGTPGPPRAILDTGRQSTAATGPFVFELEQAFKRSVHSTKGKTTTGKGQMVHKLVEHLKHKHGDVVALSFDGAA